MGFQQLGWFPCDITTTIENSVRPVAVNNRYIYPGDTFIDPDNEVVYYILGTGIGPLNESVKYYSTGDGQRHTRGKDGLTNLLQTAVSHQRCLAFGTHDPVNSDDLIYLYLSYGETQVNKSGIYHAWWKVASPDDVSLTTPTRDERNALIQDTFLQLRSRLRSRPSWDGVGYLRELVATHEGLADTITDLLDTAVETLDHRVPTAAPVTEAGRNPDSHLHKPTDSVPTIKNSQSLTLDQDNTIYVGDRFFLSVDKEGAVSGFPHCDSEESCLESAEHIVVLELKTEGEQENVNASNADSATLHYFFEDREEIFSPIELRGLITTVDRDGGQYLRCLARDGSVQVVGPTAPRVYSMHVYHVTEQTADSRETYYLLAYDSHEAKGVMLEHPLALRTVRFDDEATLLQTLTRPAEAQTAPTQAESWDASDEKFVTMCERVATSTERVGAERNLLQLESC
jgi:hypothetical protein